MEKAFLNATSYYLPSKILSNADISKKHPEWSVEKIALKTGINERRIAADDEHVSDLAIKGAENLFKEYNIDRNEIDYLILCTQNPDYSLPTTACLVQERLGLKKSIGALDINLGCSGYVYGLGVAKGLIVSKQAKNVLLITADVYSKIINERDKSNLTLFGDAAAVSLLSSKPNENGAESFEILEFEYGTDGSGYDNLIVRNGGSRKGDSDKDVNDSNGDYVRNDSCLYMNGTKIFEFTAHNVPNMVNETLVKNNLTMNDISFFVFHQANSFMLDFIRKRCGIPKEKFFVSMSDIGNTVSASIPIALKRLIEQEKNEVNNLLLCGFGVGLSIGGVILRKI